jgi:hypothetical protein
LSSFEEQIGFFNFYTVFTSRGLFHKYEYLRFCNTKLIRQTINCVLKDMLHLVSAWRQIRGYPTYGSRTHANGKTCRKTKILFEFRRLQFIREFGSQHGKLYDVLIKAEYNNRLFYYNWAKNWLSAHKFAKKLAIKGVRFSKFDPYLLAGNRFNGYPRSGRALKCSKAKRLVKVYTLGVPLLFCRFIFFAHVPKGFPRIKLIVAGFKRKMRKKRGVIKNSKKGKGSKKSKTKKKK